jgi:hypothetical protein
MGQTQTWGKNQTISSRGGRRRSYKKAKKSKTRKSRRSHC